MVQSIIRAVRSGHPVRRFLREAACVSLSLVTLVLSTPAAYPYSDGSSHTFCLQPFVGANRTATQDGLKARVLEAGKPIERELAGGQAHSYQLTLAADHYAQVVVDQRGIDVLVAVFGPDSHKLVELDSPNGPKGPEQVSLLAASPGSYTLEVRAAESKAATGRYEVRIEQLRPATEPDRRRIEAQSAYALGAELLRRGTAQSIRSAAAKFEEALALWRAVGERSREAETLGYLAQVYFGLDDYKQSLDFYNQALSLYNALAYHAGEATVLNDLGVIYTRLGDRRKALDYYDRSLAFTRLFASRADEAVTMQNMALVYQYLGETQKALEYNSQALTLERGAGDIQNEAKTLFNIGAVYKSLGEYQTALDYYDKALALEREVGNKREEAVVLNNIGAVYQASMQDRKALDYYNQALSLARSIGSRSTAATCLNNLGAVYQNLGENQKAFDHYSEALALYRAISSLYGEGLTLNNLGMYYKAIGDNQKALDYYGQALIRRRAIGNPNDVAATLYNIARLERDRGNLAEARSYIAETLAAVESLRINPKSYQLRASFFATVRKYHEFNIDLLMRLHRQQPSAGFDAAALQASESARARSLLESLAEGSSEIRQGVDPSLLERERSLRQAISDQADRQTRLLSGAHTEEQAAAAAKEIDALTTEYEQVQAQIRQTSPRYAALTQPAPLTLKEVQNGVLDDETLLLEYALGEEKSFLWAVTPTWMQSFELPKRAEVEEAARQAYELLTARNQTVANETPANRQKRIDRANAEYRQASAALSRMLLGPVAAELKGRRLVIVGEGMLQYTAFAALPAPDARPGGGSSPLIADHEIISLPSASVLAVLRRETAGRKTPDKTVAVFADPVFDRDDPRIKLSGKGRAAAGEAISSTGEVERSAAESGLRDFVRLRFSRQEADQIARLAAAGAQFKAVDFAASRATATSPELAQYAIIHFATHGLINNRHPELSGVVLSLVDEQGRPQNGFLRLYDIYNLRLAADLVVLSACQTALGKEIKGEGLVGLTRGFMYAGTPRVVATLWQINDRATAELMGRFYEAMLKQGLRPAAALRAAQVSMLKDRRWQAPHYWAAFALQGDWK